MLRFLKLVLLGILMVGIVVLSLANSSPVTLYALPEEIRQIYPYEVEVPIFAVILVSVLVGLLIGYILEWLREHKHRRAARDRKREAETLSREVEHLKKKHMTDEEEVLAILDGPRA